MDSTRESYFQKKYKQRIVCFEIETLLGMVRTIDKMHKHSIEDYKNVVECYLNCEDGKITDLRTFAPKNFPHTDFFKTLTDGRK